MTERDEAGRYARLTPGQKLRAQMEGRQPTSHATVTVENGAQTRARLEKRLGIERRTAPEKLLAEDGEAMIRRLHAEKTADKRVDTTEEANP